MCLGGGGMAGTRMFGAQVSGNVPGSSPAKLEKPRAAAFGQAKLEAAFEKIVDQNNNKLGEWGIRAQGLETLQQLVAEGACDSPHFVPLFTAMLQEPVLDMTTRSASSKPALVKVGCATVSCLATALEQGLAKHSDLYVRALLNNIRDGQTHGVIEDSQECMATLLSHVHASKMILPLTNACDVKAEKSPICRTAAIEHLSFIVQHWPPAAVKKQVSAIVECVRRMMTDSSPGARTAARQCFWHLHARYESAAEKLLATLEPSAVRQLHSVRKALGEGAGEEAEEESPSQQAEQQRPPETSRKVEPASVGATRAREAQHRRTPGLGEAQRTARDRPATADTSAAKQERPRKTAHAINAAPKTAPTAEGAALMDSSESAESVFLSASKKCADGSASVRVESFHELRRLCSDLCDTTVHRLFDKLVSLLTEHTADSNEKVATACLEALACYAESHGELLSEQHLSSLLPNVLLKTVGAPVEHFLPAHSFHRTNLTRPCIILHGSAKDRATKAAVAAALDQMQGGPPPHWSFSARVRCLLRPQCSLSNCAFCCSVPYISSLRRGDTALIDSQNV